MIKINAARVRELFERERLTDREAARRTRIPLRTIKRIQVDGARVRKGTLFALMMSFPVTRDELILAEDEDDA